MKIKLPSILLILSMSITSIGCSFQSASVTPKNGDAKIETDKPSDKIGATGDATSKVLMALGMAAMLVAAGKNGGTSSSSN